jgi:hypothetical protein
MSVVELIVSASLAAQLSQRSSLTSPQVREPGILIKKGLVSNRKRRRNGASLNLLTGRHPL